MKNKLVWEKIIEDGFPETHAATSVLHDEGSRFEYRLRKGRELWREESDQELQPYKHPRKWKSLTDAKKALQKTENEFLSDS